MDDKEKLDLTYKEVVRSWKKPEDALEYFTSLGILNEKWRSSYWLQTQANLPVESGGVGVRLAALAVAIRKHFNGHQKFIAWIDGKQITKRTSPAIVKSWHHPNDVIEYFSELDVPDENWRKPTWLNVKAGLPKSQGGINFSLGGIYQNIIRRFQTFAVFLAWIDGKLPTEEFDSPEQVREYLIKEILQLRESGKWITQTSNEPVSQLELETILSEVWVKQNPIARAAVDYLHSLNENE
jgi:hypothetical protein